MLVPAISGASTLPSAASGSFVLAVTLSSASIADANGSSCRRAQSKTMKPPDHLRNRIAAFIIGRDCGGETRCASPVANNPPMFAITYSVEVTGNSPRAVDLSTVTSFGDFGAPERRCSLSRRLWKMPMQCNRSPYWRVMALFDCAGFIQFAQVECAVIVGGKIMCCGRPNCYSPFEKTSF